MTALSAAHPRALAVRFRCLEKWSVGAHVPSVWHWPPSEIKPLSCALLRKVKELDRKASSLGSLTLVSLSFDGQIEERDLHGKTEFRGRLFLADPGDVIFSKIDVRNGAIGIIPNALGRVAVSSEFPVYEVNRTVADPEYITLLFRSHAFRRVINGMISGASGRKRVQPDELAATDVPLPALAAQQKIVADWRSRQRQAASFDQAARERRTAIDSVFMKALGFKEPGESVKPKCFTTLWQHMIRWSVSYNQQVQAGMDLSRGRYPVAALGSILTMVQYGTSQKANSDSRGTPILRINNIKDGQIDTGDLKHLELTDRELKSLRLEDGDILIIRTSGSRDLVGTCAVFREAGPFVFASYLIRLRVDRAQADPSYVAWVINSPIGRQQVNAISRQIMQNNINSEEIRNLEIPLPPLDVQRKIMAEVQAGLAEIAQLRERAKAQADAARAEVERMIIGAP